MGVLGEVDCCVAVAGVGGDWGENDGFIFLRRGVEAMPFAVSFERETEHMDRWLSRLDVCCQGLERLDSDGDLFMTKAFRVV